MEALAFVLSSTTQRTSNRFAEADRANSLIATGPETHSGKDDALCQRIPKNPPPPSPLHGILAALPSHSLLPRHARYLQGVISPLSPILLTQSVSSSISIHPPSPTWTTRIRWRPAGMAPPVPLPLPACRPSLLLRKPFVSRELSSIFHAFPRPNPPNRSPHLQDRQTATCNSQRDGKFIDGN